MAIIRTASDGTCCACGDQDGCECRKCSKLECRSRGGTVKLCGEREFPGFESTPPRFYLEKIIGGSIVICDYHSPSGKGPCEPDDCASAVGAIVSESYTGPTSCGGAAIQGNSIQATVTSVTPTPGTPGSVRVSLDVDDTHLVPSVGTGLIYLNAVAVVSSINSGKSSVYRDYVSGTAVTMVAGVDNTCVSGGTRITIGPVEFEACIPLSTSTRYAYEGKLTYNPAVNCEVAQFDTRMRRTIDQELGCSPGTTGGLEQETDSAFEPELAAYVAPSPSNSGSYKGQISSGACATDSRATACDRFEQLQSEDTDEDALARLLASPAGAWSAWQVVADGTNGTCINPACCRAAWEIRTDQTFVYREAEWRATIEGLVPGTHVTIKITVYRKAYGPGPYAELQVEEYDVTADGDGKAVATGTVLNDEGFETYVACTYTPPTP